MAWSKDDEKMSESVTDIVGERLTIIELKQPALEAVINAVEYIEGKRSQIEQSIMDAATAKTTAETVQSQFNQVVAEAGSNNPEVVLARGGEVNLNTRINKVDQQLADISHYVSRPDGKNDKAIINNALVYAGQRGLNILFPPNYTYVVSADLTKENVITIPCSNMTIDLNGSKIKLEPNSFTHYHVIEIAKKENIVIKNGEIQGDRLLHDYATVAATHEFGYGVSMLQSTVTLDNLEVYDMTGDSLINLDYVDNGDGTFSHGRGVVRVINCELHHSRRQGFSILASNEVYLDGCHIHTIGDSDGILGTAPSGGIDIEPNSRTQTVNKFEMRNTVINCEISSLIATGNCPNFVVANCELTGRIMIGDKLENPQFINTKITSEYTNSTLTVAYASKFAKFTNCKIIANRFTLLGHYEGCEIIGFDNPTFSNVIHISKDGTRLSNTVFRKLRASNKRGVLLKSVQNEENKFTFANVTIDNCDVSLAETDFGPANNYKPAITGVKFKNSYINLLRDTNEFTDCYFESMEWADTPAYFVQSLVKMTNSVYIDKKSNILINLIRKNIFGSKIELNEFGNTIFGMTGQPSYITNSYIGLSKTPANTDIINGKIINSFIRINQLSSTIDFDSKLVNTFVEFNVT